jgi:hypothetical protein
MTHALKTIQPYYGEVESGNKTFELRKFDRPFKEGDKLILQEYNDGYTGKEMELTISYILTNASKFGLKDGFCILGLR